MSIVEAHPARGLGDPYRIVAEGITEMQCVAADLYNNCSQRLKGQAMVESAALELVETGLAMWHINVDTEAVPGELIRRAVFRGRLAHVVRISGIIADLQKYEAPGVKPIAQDLSNLLWTSGSDSPLTGSGREPWCIDPKFLDELTTYCMRRGGRQLARLYNLSGSSDFILQSTRILRALERESLSVVHRHRGTIDSGSTFASSVDGGLGISYDEFGVKLITHLRSKGFYDGLVSLMITNVSSLRQMRISPL
jgi:hypothetical protein